VGFDSIDAPSTKNRALLREPTGFPGVDCARACSALPLGETART